MTKRVRVMSVWLAAVLFVALGAHTSVGQSAKSTLEEPAQAEMFNRISDRLVCQCGCNMILRVCNHFECPSAIPMRKQIEARIRSGVDEEAIVTEFVSEYGQVVLSTPPPKGINLAAWVMPGFAVLLGGFVLLYIVSDWRAKRRLKPETSTTVDPNLADRIEEELKQLDV